MLSNFFKSLVFVLLTTFSTVSLADEVQSEIQYDDQYVSLDTAIASNNALPETQEIQVTLNDSDYVKKRSAWVNSVTRGRVSLDTAAHYVRLVAENSAKNNVNPDTVLKMIMVESKFNPNAVSPCNARGLTQVIRRWWKSELKPEESLHDPVVSIRVGVKALATYIQKYSSERLALAAYNGTLKSNKYPNKVYSVNLDDGNFVFKKSLM